MKLGHRLPLIVGARRTWRQWASQPTTLGTANNTGKKSSGNPMCLAVNTITAGSGSNAPIARYIRPLRTDISDIQNSEETLTSWGHMIISCSKSIHQMLGTHQKSTFGASLRLIKYSSFIAVSCKAMAVSRSASRPVLCKLSISFEAGSTRSSHFEHLIGCLADDK